MEIQVILSSKYFGRILNGVQSNLDLDDIEIEIYQGRLLAGGIPINAETNTKALFIKKYDRNVIFRLQRLINVIEDQPLHLIFTDEANYIKVKDVLI